MPQYLCRGAAGGTSAVLSALYRRSITGQGGELHASLLDSMMSLLSNYSVAVLNRGGSE